MLPSEIERLVKGSKGSKKKAFAPYSEFTVGAALITNGGKIYHGCNIENPSLMLSFCAERAALINALAEGEKNLRRLQLYQEIKIIVFRAAHAGRCLPNSHLRLRFILHLKEELKILNLRTPAASV